MKTCSLYENYFACEAQPGPPKSGSKLDLGIVEIQDQRPLTMACVNTNKAPRGLFLAPPIDAASCATTNRQSDHHDEPGIVPSQPVSVTKADYLLDFSGSADFVAQWIVCFFSNNGEYIGLSCSTLTRGNQSVAPGVGRVFLRPITGVVSSASRLLYEKGGSQITYFPGYESRVGGGFFLHTSNLYNRVWNLATLFR